MRKLLLVLPLAISLCASEPVSFKTQKDYEEFVSALERSAIPGAKYNLSQVYLLGARVEGKNIPPYFARAEKLLIESKLPQSRVILATQYADRGELIKAAENYGQALIMAKDDPATLEVIAIVMGISFLAILRTTKKRLR
jgi:hypothetical protein